jgi:membrane protease YdiL (CAAX protease family)
MPYSSQNPPPTYRYEPPPDLRRHPERIALRRNANAIGIGLLCVYAVSYAVVFLLYFLAGILLPTQFLNSYWAEIYDTITLFSYILSFLVPCIVMIRWIRIPIYIALPLRKPRGSLVVAGVFICLGASILGGYLADSISFMVERFFGYVPTMPDLSLPSGGGSFILYFIGITIAPAFVEEMVFRGVILQSLRRFGDGFALVVSAILFAFAHGNLLQGSNTFVVGLVIGFFVLKTGSLWTAIIIHFVNNTLAVLIDLSLSHPGVTEALGNTLTNAYFMLYTIGGMLALFYVLHRYPGFLRLAPSRSDFSAGQRAAWFFTCIGTILLLLVTIFITAQYFEVA